MNIFAFSSLLAAFIIFLVGYIALFRNPKKTLNRVFFLFSVSAAYGAFTEFGYRLAESYALAQFWLRSSFLWNFTLPLELHFVLLLSNNKKLLKNKSLLFLLYSFPTVFSILSWVDSAVYEPVKVAWGWTYNLPPNTPIYFLYDTWVAGIVFIIIFVSILNIRRAQDQTKKRQAQFVLVGVLASTFFGAPELILPFIGIRIPELSSLAFAVECAVLFYAMVKYELFALTPTAAADTILATLTDVLILANPDGKIMTVNQAAQKMLGYDQTELVDQPVHKIIGLKEIAQFERVLNQQLSTQGTLRNVETVLVTKDSGKIPVSISASVIQSQNNQQGGIVYLARDLTNRKNTEELLKTSIQQKDILLREIHHRVKNNLQVISSLLLLQKNHTTDEYLSEMLNENRNRISVMAMVHELVFQSDNLTDLGISQYIHWLVNTLLTSVNAEDHKRIKITTDIEENFLNLDATINCGLIINELVSNSLKHAFPNGRTGEINVRLASDKNDQLILSVSDNGIGLAPNLDPHKADTLGMQLTTMLTQELEGSLEVSRESGTAYMITFQK